MADTDAELSMEQKLGMLRIIDVDGVKMVRADGACLLMDSIKNYQKKFKVLQPVLVGLTKAMGELDDELRARFSDILKKYDLNMKSVEILGSVLEKPRNVADVLK